MRSAVRVTLTLLLVVAGTACGLYGGLVISNIWDDYRDFTTSVYLGFGLGFLAISAACFAAAVFVFRRGREQP